MASALRQARLQKNRQLTIMDAAGKAPSWQNPHGNAKKILDMPLSSNTAVSRQVTPPEPPKNHLKSLKLAQLGGISTARSVPT